MYVYHLSVTHSTLKFAEKLIFAMMTVSVSMSMTSAATSCSATTHNHRLDHYDGLHDDRLDEHGLRFGELPR